MIEPLGREIVVPNPGQGGRDLTRGGREIAWLSTQLSSSGRTAGGPGLILGTEGLALGKGEDPGSGEEGDDGHSQISIQPIDDHLHVYLVMCKLSPMVRSREVSKGKEDEKTWKFESQAPQPK